MNLVFQGIVNTTLGTKIDCFHDNMTISLIIINNFSSNYTFNLHRSDIGADNYQILHSFELNAGDSIRDVTKYVMAKGDYIFLNVQPEDLESITTYYLTAEVL